MTGKDFWTFESLGCPQPEDKLWDQVLVHDTLVSWGALRRSPKHGGLVQSCHLTSALVPGPKAHPCSSLGLRYSPAKWKEGTQYFLTLTMHPHHFSSVQFSHSVVSNSLRPHEPQHASTPCPSPTPRVYPNSCPLSQWYHPIITSYVFDWENAIALHAMPWNRASSRWEGEVSWVFSSCGRHLGYILELRRGCPF